MLRTAMKSIMLVAAVSTGGLALPVFAASTTTVNVSLTDAGGEATPATDMGMTMMGDHQMAVMHVTADKAEVPAGKVTFAVTNKSRDIVHEMLVVKVASTAKPLPYDEAEGRVNEEAAGDLGEVSELDPGGSGSLTLTLDKGTYMLFCNVPGHYAAGMWTLVTVI